MSRDSGSDDDEEESMMSHIDYDIDYDGSSSMEDMELYSDNSFPCMDEETLMDYEEFISRMESENCYTMTSKPSFNKLDESRGTLYGETSSSPRYSPSSSRRRHKHKGDNAHDPHRQEHHVATQGRLQQ